MRLRAADISRKLPADARRSTNDRSLLLDHRKTWPRPTWTCPAPAQRPARLRGGGATRELHARRAGTARHPGCGQPPGEVAGRHSRRPAVPPFATRAGADGGRRGAAAGADRGPAPHRQYARPVRGRTTARGADARRRRHLRYRMAALAAAGISAPRIRSWICG